MKASLLFITYNHARFVAEAIRSAMAQDYSDLELVVCDDASTDDTRKILEAELTKCPQHLTQVQAHSSENVGLISNFNRGIAACSGEVVIVMSGDDISCPDRVSKIVEEFVKNPRSMLVYSNYQSIDSAGRFLAGSRGSLKNRCFSHDQCATEIYANSPVYGATAAYRMNLRDEFGPLQCGHHPEDRCYWLRALLVGEIHYLPHALVEWRVHETNLDNHLRELDSPVARAKMIRKMLFKQHYAIQLTRDVRHAVNGSLISQPRGLALVALIQIARERERLRRYSMSASSWKLWFGSARKLILLQPSFRTARRVLLADFWIHRSRARRERRWASRFRPSA